MTEPTILQVIRAQRTALLRRDAETLRRYAEQWRDVERAIRDAAELLAVELAEMAANGQSVPEWRLYQMERYQELLRQAQAHIRTYADEIAPQVAAEQAAFWRMGSADALAQIGAITSAFNTLPVSATNTMIGFAANGSPLRNVLQSHWPHAIDGITRELIRGMAMGINPRVVARNAARGSQASLKQMLTVARTEQLRAYREATRDTYQRSGVVERYRRVCARGPRTCIVCLALDGKTYPVSQQMPTHPNCRCTMSPELAGYTINYGQSGSDWFASQDADVQREMLGPTRYRMYREGAPLTAFAEETFDPVWGAGLRLRPLGERAA